VTTVPNGIEHARSDTPCGTPVQDASGMAGKSGHTRGPGGGGGGVVTVGLGLGVGDGVGVGLAVTVGLTVGVADGCGVNALMMTVWSAMQLFARLRWALELAFASKT